MIALVPARSGSKRLPKKNLRALAGKPLVLWVLQAAFDSEVFSEVYVSTDSHEIAELVVSHTGCKHIQRPSHLATDDSPDIDWVCHALGTIGYLKGKHDEPLPGEMCILRPTSPFLTPETLQRAKAHWDDIKGDSRPHGTLCSQCGEVPWRCRHIRGYDSMRAIRRAQEPAWKQWRFDEQSSEIDPITSVAARKHLHSRPTQTLEDCWIQTAGFEMSWTRTALDTGTIAGDRVAGFPLDHPDSLDINTQQDWWDAERVIARRALEREKPPEGG